MYSISAILSVIPDLGSLFRQNIWATLGQYLNTIQVIHFFLISYLISRLYIRYKVPERFVHWIFEEKHLSLSKLALMLIFGTALVSMVISNLIALLSLLPVILMIQSEIPGPPAYHKKFSTMVMLAAIWGANIGGLAMLTGTPSNGAFLGVLEAKRAQVLHSFTFLSWIVWAAPLAMLLCLTGWIILMLVFRPDHSVVGERIRKNLTNSNVPAGIQRLTLVLTGMFILGSSALSFAMNQPGSAKNLIYFITLGWTLAFILLLFFVRFRSAAGDKPQVLLTLRDTIRDFPKNGVLWIAIGLAATSVLFILGVPQAIAKATMGWVQADLSLLLLMLLFAVGTTFLTELVSVTMILLTLFTALWTLGSAQQALSWQLMLTITLTSSCAFMTPLATPVNGLGYGSSRIISLPYMLASGFLMNLASAGLITLWVYLVVPVVLSWFA